MGAIVRESLCISTEQILQLIKKPESGVNGATLQEVQGEKTNSLTLQEPYQIGRNVNYFYIQYIQKALTVMQEIAQANK
jgi:hypothetical protein